MRYFIIGGLKEGHATFKEAERHASHLAKGSPGHKFIIAKAHAEVVVKHTVTMLDEDAEGMADAVDKINKDEYDPFAISPPSSDENPQKLFVEERSEVSAEFLRAEQGEVK